MPEITWLSRHLGTATRRDGLEVPGSNRAPRWEKPSQMRGFQSPRFGRRGAAGEELAAQWHANAFHSTGSAVVASR